jgi:hypothetical protein
MSVGLNIKYRLFLSGLKGKLIGCRKMLKYKSSPASFLWEESRSMGTDKREDPTKILAAFCHFANAPKKQDDA